MNWIKKLHWQILIALVLGFIYGIMATQFGWEEFTRSWITPFGEIFIRLLKACAVPLVIVSLICGVASLSDTSKLSRLGGKTILTYLATTAIAITIGLIIANIFNPGKGMDKSVADQVMTQGGESAQQSITKTLDGAASVKNRGPLQPLIDLVPDNFVSSVGDNRNMLQIVVMSVLFGVTIVLVPRRESRPVIDFFNGLNSCLITAIKLIIYLAPIGVFSLLATSIANAGGNVSAVIGSLGMYALTVVLALVIHGGIVYPAIIHFLTPLTVSKFFKAIWPAQTFAFSTSSSAATLPITMERCKNNLNIPKENCSFVLPLGATINMDGTALYQAVAAIFIANAVGEPLGLGAQFQVLALALLASIGTAAVPSAGMVMLVVILEKIGIPIEAIGLIWALDRPLDMLRTAVNVTGDAAVATFISSSDIKQGIDYGSSSPGRPDRRRNNNNRRRFRPNNKGQGQGHNNRDKDGNENQGQQQKGDRPNNNNQRRRRPNNNQGQNQNPNQNRNRNRDRDRNRRPNQDRE